MSTHQQMIISHILLYYFCVLRLELYASDNNTYVDVLCYILLFYVQCG